jgi:hypothetical protein
VEFAFELAAWTADVGELSSQQTVAGPRATGVSQLVGSALQQPPAIQSSRLYNFIQNPGTVLLAGGCVTNAGVATMLIDEAAEHLIRDYMATGKANPAGFDRIVSMLCRLYPAAPAELIVHQVARGFSRDMPGTRGSGFPRRRPARPPLAKARNQV